MARHSRDLRLIRSLGILDCRTTGTTPRRDRILEVSVVRYAPRGKSGRFGRRINPVVPILASANDVQGLTHYDVTGCPTVAAIAPGLVRFLRDADPAGSNSVCFDLPMLLTEFRRADVAFPLADRTIVDGPRLAHRYEPHDLAGAVRPYPGQDHQGTPRAIADACATAAVLDRMPTCYPELPRSVAELRARLTIAFWPFGSAAKTVGLFSGSASMQVTWDTSCSPSPFRDLDPRRTPGRFGCGKVRGVEPGPGEHPATSPHRDGMPCRRDPEPKEGGRQEKARNHSCFFLTG